MERYYRFAGVELAVSLPDDRAYTDEYRMAPFAVEAVADPHVFRFEVVDSLDAPTGICIADVPGCKVYEDGQQRLRYLGAVSRAAEDAYIRVRQCGKINDVQLREKWYPGRIGTKAILTSIEAAHLIARAGGFIFHCSYIDRGGKAILFTAPSETGKSTQAELWKNLRGAEIINGDRAAVRIVDSRILAEGIPFAGSSQYCKNRSLEVEAIVYLGQAPRTTIRRMQGVEAFARIWEGVSANTWDETDMELISEVVQQIAMTIPVYHLPCTPDESAVTALERTLKAGEL